MFALQVAEDWRSADLLDNEDAMLEYVEKIALAAATITRDDVDRVREAGWDDHQILAIALVASYYNFRCRMADSLGVELDEDVAGDDMRQALESRGVVPQRS